MESKFIRNSDWMKELFGFTDKNHETTFSSVKNIYSYKNGILEINDNIYDAGIFSSFKLRELLDALKVIKPKQGENIIDIIYGTDVSDYHLNCEEFEVIQAASQFNALEMISPNISGFDGIYNYINDNTQGPRCALMAAPGLFIRAYDYYFQNNKFYNALESLDVEPVNGYLIWGNNPEKYNFIKEKYLDIEICGMFYTQVNGVIPRKNDEQVIYKTNKYVHQVYSSAVPINVYGNRGDYQAQLELSKIFLRTAYMGTIALGLILYSFDKEAGITKLDYPVINLTLLGGGVFNTPINIIVECIREAINHFKQYQFKVNIHVFDKRNEKFFKDF